jgi:pheromone shutdown protein TraB
VRLLSGLQERYARLAGAEVGTDMLSALRAARAEGLPVALIDDDIGSTMEGLARSVGPRDLLRFAVRAVRPDPWARRLDLTAVPDDELVEEMLRELERAFPRAHDVLVRRRDLRMASRLLRLASEHGTVLAVVGAGHKSGIRRLLTGSPHEVTLLAL